MPLLQSTSQHDINITYPKLNKSRRSHMTIKYTSVLKQATRKHWNITDQNHRFHQYNHPNRNDPKSSTHIPTHDITWHHQKNTIIPSILNKQLERNPKTIDQRLRGYTRKVISFTLVLQKKLESTTKHLIKLIIEHTWHITMVGYKRL